MFPRYSRRGIDTLRAVSLSIPGNFEVFFLEEDDVRALHHKYVTSELHSASNASMADR